MAQPEALQPASLYRRCDPDSLSFSTTDELEPLGQIPGQDRALEALRFGTRVRSEGFNLFVLGPNGIGKRTLVRRYLDDQASQEPAPADWCYVHNFDHPNRPKLLELGAGEGEALRTDLDDLIDELRNAIPATFESDEYQNRIQELQQEFNQRQEEAFKEVQDEAEQYDIALIQTPGGFTFAPKKEDGHVMGSEEFHELPKEERDRIESLISDLQDRLQRVLRQIPKWRKESQEKVRELNKEMAQFAVGHRIEDLKERYQGYDRVQGHLDAIQQDVIDHVEAFTGQGQGGQAQGKQQLQLGDEETGPLEATLHRYQANVVVDNSEQNGAPVVYEDLPTHQHLVGRVEHRAQQGALFTDFTLIKPGALHKANGGYLLLDARKVLMQPFAWESLKRALYAREARIESIEQMYSLLSTVSLEPEAAPLDVKVILLGDRFLYYLLSEYDPDFQELFKVQADFEEDLPRTDDNNAVYARLIGTIAQQEGLAPFDRGAVARVIEHGSRLVEDGQRLSAHAGSIADLLREASFWAGESGRDTATAEDVQTAIDKQTYRADRVRERMERAIQRDIVLIDTEGDREGQVNGLAVLQLGGFAFGRPHRITATARVGDGNVVDIEREADLGGSIHSKGVMILSSLLGARYAPDESLSLTASITFEQSYGMVEGDSASVAELCALLSALTDTPFRQDVAVTGSVNQHGQVQAIGGVNEKVEGFFDICSQRGLTGEQGVMIPAANVEHLMLRRDVREAAEAGRFHIYPIQRVDDALSLFSGLSAGEPDEEGAFPEGTFNRRVANRLRELARLRRENNRDDDADGQRDES
jgi:lon-related putative ATP-dependent protease